MMFYCFWEKIAVQFCRYLLDSRRFLPKMP